MRRGIRRQGGERDTLRAFVRNARHGGASKSSSKARTRPAHAVPRSGLCSVGAARGRAWRVVEGFHRAVVSRAYRAVRRPGGTVRRWRANVCAAASKLRMAGGGFGAMSRRSAALHPRAAKDGRPNRQNGIQPTKMNAVNRLDRTTIVLVEDDPESRASLASLLESEGANVIAVADAETGVEEAIRLSPDAVVCDLDLPAMDGFYLIQRLRDHEIRSDHAPTVAVALTGHTDESWRLRSFGEGFHHFMTKPAQPDELVTLLRDAIDARHSL